MDEACRVWLDSKAVATRFLDELLPDPSRTPERNDALTSALFARLAHADLLTVRLDKLTKAEKAEALLWRLIHLRDAAAKDDPDMNGNGFGKDADFIADEARKLLEG